MFSDSQAVESNGSNYQGDNESFTQIAELLSLRFQYKEKRDELEASEKARAEQQEAIQSLERQLREKDTLLKNGQERERGLALEIAELNRKFAEAGEANEQRQQRFLDFVQHQQDKIAQLRQSNDALTAQLEAIANGSQSAPAPTDRQAEVSSFFQEFSCFDPQANGGESASAQRR